MGPEDVKKIIESRFLKKSKDPEAAVDELAPGGVRVDG